MVLKFFNKKIKSRTRATSKMVANVNVVLTQESHKPVNKKFKRNKVYLRFKDDFWTADLAEIRSLSSKNEGVEYLLHFIYVFIKHDWIKFLTDFVWILNKPKFKPK